MCSSYVHINKFNLLLYVFLVHLHGWVLDYWNMRTWVQFSLSKYFYWIALMFQWYINLVWQLTCKLWHFKQISYVIFSIYKNQDISNFFTSETNCKRKKSSQKPQRLRQGYLKMFSRIAHFVLGVIFFFSTLGTHVHTYTLDKFSKTLCSMLHIILSILTW